MSDKEGREWESYFAGDSAYMKYLQVVREFGVDALVYLYISSVSKIKRIVAEFYRRRAMAAQIATQAAVQQGATTPQQIQQQAAIIFGTSGVTAATIASEAVQRKAEFLVDFPAISFLLTIGLFGSGSNRFDYVVASLSDADINRLAQVQNEIARLKHVEPSIAPNNYVGPKTYLTSDLAMRAIRLGKNPRYAAPLSYYFTVSVDIERIEKFFIDMIAGEVEYRKEQAAEIAAEIENKQVQEQLNVESIESRKGWDAKLKATLGLIEGNMQVARKSLDTILAERLFFAEKKASEAFELGKLDIEREYLEKMKTIDSEIEKEDQKIVTMSEDASKKILDYVNQINSATVEYQNATKSIKLATGAYWSGKISAKQLKQVERAINWFIAKRKKANIAIQPTPSVVKPIAKLTQVVRPALPTQVAVVTTARQPQLPIQVLPVAQKPTRPGLIQRPTTMQDFMCLGNCSECACKECGQEVMVL